MPLNSNTSNKITTFNKYGLHLKWPRIWIIILGIILIFLCFCIVGMEIGHTIFDLRRSTAFGGFIVFLPLMTCAILILITAFKPRLRLVRIATILCLVMIILCFVLIAYDILVLIDPTRCFFFNCNDAIVNASNSTTNITVSGWPLSITWPTYFNTNMTAKRIFQSIQILCASLFILFSTLYILTCFIYRKINLDQNTNHNSDQRTFTGGHDTIGSPTKHLNNTVKSNLPYGSNRHITTYMIDGRRSSITKYHPSTAPLASAKTVTPQKTKRNTILRPRANSANFDRICTRCMKEPRMILSTNFERQNYFSHLCSNCNNEILNYRRKGPLNHSTNSRSSKP